MEIIPVIHCTQKIGHSLLVSLEHGKLIMFNGFEKIKDKIGEYIDVRALQPTKPDAIFYIHGKFEPKGVPKRQFSPGILIGSKIFMFGGKGKKYMNDTIAIG